MERYGWCLHGSRPDWSLRERSASLSEGSMIRTCGRLTFRYQTRRVDVREPFFGDIIDIYELRMFRDLQSINDLVSSDGRLWLKARESMGLTA